MSDGEAIEAVNMDIDRTSEEANYRTSSADAE